MPRLVRLRAVPRMAWPATLILCLTLPACGSKTGPAGALRLPLQSNFFLDPAKAPPSDMWPESLVYSGLFKFDVALNVVPDLAVSLPTISNNGKSYAITVRSDARFDDGSYVTAADVAWSLSRAVSRQEASTAARNALSAIRGASLVQSGAVPRLLGVRVTGRHSLTIHLVHPDPWFLIDLALPVASVLEPSAVRHGDNWWRLGGSAAPFRIASFGSVITLRANPNYDNGKPQLATIVLMPVTSTTQSESLYRRHKLDASPVPSHDFSSAQALSGFQATDSERAFYVLPAATISQRVRVALAEALDRGELASPTSPIDPLDSVVPTQIVPDYPAVPNPFPFVPRPSRRMLAASKLWHLYGPRGPVASELRGWLDASWRAAGFHVASASAGLTLTLIKVGIAFPAAQIWLQKIGEAAYHGSNSVFTRMLSTAGRVVVSQGLGPEWTADNKAESLLLSKARVIPVGVEREGYLISPRVQGLTVAPGGLEPANENWATVSVG